METISERQLMSRAAWLYYLGGLNQEETSARLGLTRARVNKLLQQARSEGIVSVTIDHRELGLLPTEDRLTRAFGLELCICTPPIGLPDGRVESALAEFPRRAVGAAAARLLRDRLADKPDLVVGTGWGRTLEQMTLHVAGLSAPQARFVSLMGSLTANSAFNPFEVVQALARSSGGQGWFLPVPFIADSAAVREILISQRTVAEALRMARGADMALISVGELTEDSLLRQRNMISATELSELRRAGAVGDTNGIFFDGNGRPVEHDLNHRTLAVTFEQLRRSFTVVLAAGMEKVEATFALLRSGIAKGLIIDGDSALKLACLLEEPDRPRG
jgi:DNA-binding transcriptional regulator LsrR (DeoR family)